MRNKIALAIAAVLFCGMARGQTLYNSGDTLYIGGGATLYFGGNIQNTGKAVIKNNGSMNITGNLSNGNINMYSGTGLFEMSGTGTQSFSGANYYNMKVSGTGNKNMVGPTYLKNSLVFTNGMINTSLTKDTIFMDSTAALYEIQGSEVTGYVKYSKYLAKNNIYNFGSIGLTLQALGGTPGYTVIVRGTGDSAIQYGMTKQGVEQGTKRFFDVHPKNDEGLDATMSFYYRDCELNGIPAAELALFRSMDNGATWTYMGFANRDLTNNIVTLSGVNTFSRWTTGSSSQPLPVELTTFDVTKNGNDAQLQWQTASETNNNYFGIERSLQGKVWDSLGYVNGNGTTSDVHNYNYTDININLLLAQVLYYRLKQVDINGNYVYSPVKELDLGTVNNASLKAWYNAEEDRVYINYTTSAEESFTMRLTDIQGKVISSEKAEAIAGLTQTSINMFGLTKGMYLLNVTNAAGMQTRKIMKN